MIEIVKAAVQRGASDLHLKAGDVVRARVNGALQPLTKQRLTPEQTRQIASQLISDPRDRERLDDLKDYDCSWAAPGVGRFRVNILRQRGTFMVVMRVIPMEVPTLDDLGLPPVLRTIAEAERGLVLVTGITGSGKSTTLAAMIDHINATSHRHVITLEDPIEFLHRDREASVTQREVGGDTASFAVGLRAALREDPDVILVGEMRDTETIDTALKAAETGHLVLSTLHTQNAVRTVSRIVAVFPPEEQEMVRVRFAETIVAVISQRLLPRKNASGRAAAVEVMLGTGTVKDVLREPERIDEIFDLMAQGREQYGSQTFDQHLMDLVREEAISYEIAKAAANNPGDFELKMRMFA